jgi:MFS family permease
MLLNKRFMLLIFVLGLIFTGFIVWLTAGPLLVIEHLQYSPMVFGVIQAIVFLAYMLGSHLVKHILEKMGLKSLIWLGLLVTLAGGWAAMLVTQLFSLHLPLFIAALTIYSFGSALCFAPLNRIIIESSREPMGVRVSLFTVLWTLFAVLGSFIASIWYDGSIGSIAWPITLAISISCILHLFIPSEKNPV